MIFILLPSDSTNLIVSAEKWIIWRPVLVMTYRFILPSIELVNSTPSQRLPSSQQTIEGKEPLGSWKAVCCPHNYQEGSAATWWLWQKCHLSTFFPFCRSSGSDWYHRQILTFHFCTKWIEIEWCEWDKIEEQFHWWFHLLTSPQKLSRKYIARNIRALWSQRPPRCPE